VSGSESDQDWVDVYADQRDVYDAFVKKLRVLVETLLDENEADYAWVISFSSTPGNLEGDLARARRAARPVEKPLESSLRVAGVRVGVHNNVPGGELGDLIRREFVVDAEGSLPIEDASRRNERPARDRPQPIAYDYAHYLVSLDERRLELTEWSRFVGLKARIEITTLLQDAWEDLDLDLPFYDDDSYPAEVRKLLARSTAGLAAVDEQLTEAHHGIWRLHRDYEEAVEAGELQIGLNGVSLRAYLITSELVAALTELAVDVGFTPYPEYEPGWQAIEPGILWLLRRDDVHTLAELEEFLELSTSRARDMLAELQRLVSDRNFVPWAQPETIVEWLWLVLRRADAETVSLLQYREELEHALNTLIGNPVPAEEPDAT
jgi:ppGpp synthetase/RelA/SpoT-type nucleotidyltranferase